MEPSELAEVIERARGSLRRVLDLYMRAPESVKDGSMERALLDLAASLRDLEDAMGGGWVVRRPFTGLSTEAQLLGGLAMALRMRMEQLGRTNVTGLEDFLRRVRELVDRASAGLGGPQTWAANAK